MDWLTQFAETIAREFTDLVSPDKAAQACLRMSLAALLGAVIGIERLWEKKAAGPRTHMLLCLGAAVFTLSPYLAGASLDHLTRVLQGLVAGIGFLGAGAILKSSDEESIRGLTTATGLWLTAGIGMAVGLGQCVMAIVATVLTLGILLLVRHPKK